MILLNKMNILILDEIIVGRYEVFVVKTGQVLWRGTYDDFRNISQDLKGKINLYKLGELGIRDEE